MIDNEFAYKNYVKNIKSRKSPSIFMKIRKMLLFSKSFSVSISFLVSIKNHLCYPNKEKTYELFVYSFTMFPVIDPSEHIKNYIIIVT